MMKPLQYLGVSLRDLPLWGLSGPWVSCRADMKHPGKNSQSNCSRLCQRFLYSAWFVGWIRCFYRPVIACF